MLALERQVQFLSEKWTESYLNTVRKHRKKKLYMVPRTPDKVRLCRVWVGVVRVCAKGLVGA
jgi:hypothetical protein